MVAASIRSNNPGAMWGKGNKIAAKWGSTGTQNLADGLGQGNNIAYFPSKVQGACAQFDLWRTGYCNMTLRNAILKWSGHNWSAPYADFLVQRTGLSLETIITPQILAGPQGLRLMVAQAQWEAGTPYPMSNIEWTTAQNKVFLQSKPPTTVGQKKAAAVVVATATTTSTAVAAASQGSHWSVVLGVLVFGAVAAGIVWFAIHRHHEATTSPPGPNPPGNVPPLEAGPKPPSGV